MKNLIKALTVAALMSSFGLQAGSGKIFTWGFKIKAALTMATLGYGTYMAQMHRKEITDSANTVRNYYGQVANAMHKNPYAVVGTSVIWGVPTVASAFVQSKTTKSWSGKLKPWASVAATTAGAVGLYAASYKYPGANK
ncbi:hypothetical protein KJZ61_03870 [Candidatus Dependentiae bacterium]|nr:hypothetical protein [Candidatus Dependentiae bacterium]